MEYHNNTPDQLQGVQIQIPHIEGNSSSQFFNLFVWIDSLDDTPEYLQTGVKVYYTDTYFDTLQGFTTYALLDSNDQKISLDLPEGQFYIGWEQSDISGQKIPIGYDLNSPAGINFLHFNVGQGWQSGRSSGLRHGSLMIRPVLGVEGVIPTKINNFTEWKEIRLFPNPSEGVVYLDGVDGIPGKIEVFNLLGQLLLETTLQKSIDLSILNQGTYAIKITSVKEQKTTSRLLQMIE
ncbi:MAG: T9SS type A sorting domain-containing protein [Saprospiraceae bacterium]|nr:T9SS type A sorting domain-containing protein [Saprospiraceae bacterium]